jgi:hypothetical protein
MSYRFLKWPFISAITAFVCYVPFLFIRAFDSLSILYLLILGAVFLIFLVIVLAIRTIYKRRPSGTIILTVLVFVFVSTLMFLSAERLRPRARWLFLSKSFKREVLHLVADPKNGLRYEEWDGWGMAGQDTIVFLIYDPTDELGEGLRNSSSGQFAAIARHTWHWERLERCWYSVTFYTNDPWASDE